MFQTLVRLVEHAKNLVIIKRDDMNMKSKSYNNELTIELVLRVLELLEWHEREQHSLAIKTGLRLSKSKKQTKLLENDK